MKSITTKIGIVAIAILMIALTVSPVSATYFPATGNTQTLFNINGVVSTPGQGYVGSQYIGASQTGSFNKQTGQNVNGLNAVVQGQQYISVAQSGGGIFVGNKQTAGNDNFGLVGGQYITGTQGGYSNSQNMYNGNLVSGYSSIASQSITGTQYGVGNKQELINNNFATAGSQTIVATQG